MMVVLAPCSSSWCRESATLLSTWEKSIYLLCVKPTFKRFKASYRLFTDLSVQNVINSASTFVPFTSNELLRLGKLLLVFILVLLCFLSIRVFFLSLPKAHYHWLTNELPVCAGCLPIWDWGVGGVKRHWLVSIKGFPGGPSKTRQAFWPIVQFSKLIFSAF